MAGQGDKGYPNYTCPHCGVEMTSAALLNPQGRHPRGAVGKTTCGGCGCRFWWCREGLPLWPKGSYVYREWPTGKDGRPFTATAPDPAELEERVAIMHQFHDWRVKTFGPVAQNAARPGVGCLKSEYRRARRRRDAEKRQLV